MWCGLILMAKPSWCILSGCNEPSTYRNNHSTPLTPLGVNSCISHIVSYVLRDKASFQTRLIKDCALHPCNIKWEQCVTQQWIRWSGVIGNSTCEVHPWEWRGSLCSTIAWRQMCISHPRWFSMQRQLWRHEDATKVIWAYISWWQVSIWDALTGTIFSIMMPSLQVWKLWCRADSKS